MKKLKIAVKKVIGTAMVLIPLGGLVAFLCKHCGIFETVIAFGIAVIVTICITTGLWLLLE